MYLCEKTTFFVVSKVPWKILSINVHLKALKMKVFMRTLYTMASSINNTLIKVYSLYKTHIRSHIQCSSCSFISPFRVHGFRFGFEFRPGPIIKSPECVRKVCAIVKITAGPSQPGPNVGRSRGFEEGHVFIRLITSVQK